MRLTRTASFLRHTRRGGTDTRSVPANLVEDPTFIPRLSWRTMAAPGGDPAASIAAIDSADNTHSFFLDGSVIDVATDPALVRALLREPERLRITRQVRAELEPFLGERPDHPLSVALAEGDPAIVIHDVPDLHGHGRVAFEYYVTLLALRRFGAGVVRQSLADERRVEPGEVAEAEVLDHVQRAYGDRGRLLAAKSPGPVMADEVLVYLAFEHALRTGRPTGIVTHDQDVLEQLFKLTWMATGHYRAMFCADAYARDFASFRTVPVPTRHADEPWWPIETSGAVLVDASRWGRGLDGVLPRSGTFVSISCWMIGPNPSQMSFGAEREMTRLLDVKDVTRGRSTAELGSRNLHASFPSRIAAGLEPGIRVLIGRDVTESPFNTQAKVPRLDMLAALHSVEVPRRVELRQAIRQPLAAPRMPWRRYSSR
jgi:hypothetical protein